MYYNQLSSIKDKKRILKSVRENNLLCKRESPKGNQQISHQELCRLKGSRTIYSKCWGKKLLTNNTLSIRGILTERELKGFSDKQELKDERIRHHLTGLIRAVKGISLG